MRTHHTHSATMSQWRAIGLSDRMALKRKEVEILRWSYCFQYFSVIFQLREAIREGKRRSLKGKDSGDVFLLLRDGMISNKR